MKDLLGVLLTSASLNFGILRRDNPRIEKYNLPPGIISNYVYVEPWLRRSGNLNWMKEGRRRNRERRPGIYGKRTGENERIDGGRKRNLGHPGKGIRWKLG